MQHGPSRRWQIGVAALGAVLMFGSQLSAQVVLQPVGKPLQPNSSGIVELRFSPDSKKLLANKAHVWNVETAERFAYISVPPPVAQLSRTELSPQDVVFTPDSKTIIAFSQNYVQRWDAAKGKPLAREVALVPITAPQGQYMVGPIAVRHDGKVMLAHHVVRTPGGAGKAESKFVRQGILLNPVTGQRLGSALPYEEKGNLGALSGVRACAFTPDGKQVITFHATGRIRLWDGGTGKRKAKDLTHPGNLNSNVGADKLHISSDGQTFLTAGADSIQRWDLATGEALGAPLKAGAVVAFSPDGKTLAVGGARESNNAINVVDAASGKSLASWLLKSEVRRLKFSPDGKYLLSVAEDYAVVLWEPATGKQLAVVQQQTKGLSAAAFSPDGKLLATSTSDRPVYQINLWRLP